MSEIGTELTITPADGGFDLVGEIDAHTAPELDAAVTAYIGDHHQLRLGMEGVTFMDSSGLRVLIAATESCRARGGDVVLDRPTATVVRLLEISGLADHFTVSAG